MRPGAQGPDGPPHSGDGGPGGRAFAGTIRATFGPAGAAWLDALPAILGAAAARWSLTLEPPFPLSYHYVAPARRADGRAVVLKAGLPRPELGLEIAALRLYDGRGAVRLLAADEAAGLLLLDHVTPGTPLARMADDEEATRIGAEVASALWRPAPPRPPFPTVADWAAGLGRLRARFGGGTGPFPAPLVDRAEGLFRELLASAGPPELLHGDFHHGNVLESADGRWLAIDPQGVVGERAFDLANFLRNPLETLPRAADRRARLDRRLALLAEHLALDRERLRGWALAFAVLSEWWDFEDGGGASEAGLAVAEDLWALGRPGVRP